MNQISPLAKKLQIKPGKRWLFYNAPENYLAALDPLPDDVSLSINADGSFDGIQVFVISSYDLTGCLEIINPLLKPDTILWISYPKKSSGIKSDLEMMGSWDEPAKYGLGVVASASVNETWTALRLKPVGQSKISEFRNEEIKNNEHAAYIDVENKQITLPADIKRVLEQVPDALSFYQRLSYSNRKEYVVWILSAKQETTKAERLVKLVDKLSAGKKNPSEK